MRIYFYIQATISCTLLPNNTTQSSRHLPKQRGVTARSLTHTLCRLDTHTHTHTQRYTHTHKHTHTHTHFIQKTNLQHEDTLTDKCMDCTPFRFFFQVTPVSGIYNTCLSVWFVNSLTKAAILQVAYLK